MSASMLGAALRDFRELVGDDHVVTKSEALDAAATATFATAARPSAIVRPASSDEVAAVVRAARRHRVALYPVSRGTNWGLGSRVPTFDGAVLLELRRMNRISGYDEELATVTVQPGVTFRALYDYLRSRRSRLFANTTGGSPNASVLANALERGDGTGPRGDRFSHVCALCIVLGTGELLRTGFSRFADTPLAPLHRYGVGPALDGLFSQSNLGIVTELTLWLTPLPRALAAVRFGTRAAELPAAAVDALSQLRLEGTLTSVCSLWNDYRVLSVEEQYPWEESGGRTPLPREVLERRDYGGMRWFGLAAVYGASVAQCDAGVARVREVLSPHVDTLSVEQRSGEPQSGAELFSEAEPALQFLQGIPHEGSLRSLYFRKRMAVPGQMDPDRDRCGVLWLCPTLPFRGRDAAEAAACAEEILSRHGFEPLLAMVAPTERTLYLMPLIVYDREIVGEDERAQTCHDELLAALCTRGFLPHRLGVQSMGSLPPAQDDFADVLQRLKHALDPDAVIAPGRYDRWD